MSQLKYSQGSQQVSAALPSDLTGCYYSMPVDFRRPFSAGARAGSVVAFAYFPLYIRATGSAMPTIPSCVGLGAC